MFLEKRWLTYEQMAPDYSEPAETTPLQSEEEGETERSASPVPDLEGAPATRIAAIDLQRLLVASSERL